MLLFFLEPAADNRQSYLYVDGSAEHAHFDAGGSFAAVDLGDPAFAVDHGAFGYHHLVAFVYGLRQADGAVLLGGEGVDERLFGPIEGYE